MTKSRASVVAAVVAATLLTSCGPAPDGPLRFSTEKSSVCMPVADYPVAAFGVNLPSDLAEPIEITSVEALGLDDLHVDSIQLMPVSETFRLLAEAYPPTESFPEAWPRSTAAVGRTVEAGAVFDLVLEVRSGPEGGSLDGIRVRYTAGGREFVADTVVELVLSPTPCV